MKIERVSEHIWSLISWMLIPVRVWVVVDADGVTLVDAGFPFMAKGILTFIDRLGAGPLQRILLTHGHSDHVGSIQSILDREPVPVYAHPMEIPYMEGDLTYPRRKKREYNVAKGVAKPLTMDRDGHLERVGGLRPYHTPGHSPGHVVYYHEEDRVLLAGDLFTSKNGKLHRPMPRFTGNMAEALKSGVIVKQLNPWRLEICHGKPVFHPADHWEEYLQKTARHFPIQEI